MPGFLSICLNWAPSTASECCSPHLGPRGEIHSLAGEGVGEPNSNEGTDTLVLYVYYKLLYVSLWRYTEFQTWKKSRNYTTRNSAEFRRNCSQFLTEYGIDGSKKNRRNSVSAWFRGHPTLDWGRSEVTRTVFLFWISLLALLICFNKYFIFLYTVHTYGFVKRLRSHDSNITVQKIILLCSGGQIDNANR